jgi:3-deoxy-7-phosphoheptulonate synthase
MTEKNNYLTNRNIESIQELKTPRQQKLEVPLSLRGQNLILESRQTIEDIIKGIDSLNRKLVVVGPCSIHDIESAKEYGHRLKELQAKVGDKLYLVMRTYFEKPRTTRGWKGLILDPRLDGSYDVDYGINQARQILTYLSDNGIPTGTELLDPMTPQYLDDSLSWATLGARTIESQTHRQMASGTSMPMGYKNSTHGTYDEVINAIIAASERDIFLGISDDGKASRVITTGNLVYHPILRGGIKGLRNYGADSIQNIQDKLKDAGLNEAVMVDCSHDNCEKDYLKQLNVIDNVIDQIVAGNKKIIGLMIESNLVGGKQKLVDPKNLVYGQSITDGCISFEDTEKKLLEIHSLI